jgi:hypothetical protein
MIVYNKGNIYDIYEQDIPEIDMSTHLRRWKALLEARIGRELEADDFLFPYIAPNGVIHIKRAMSYSTLQVLLTKFSQGAGVEKHYTTHCFRRGGAQYQFMFAPIGKRWSLSRIRWWGGWAVGEHVWPLKHCKNSVITFNRSTPSSSTWWTHSKAMN